jgi:hypothetical protein
MPMRALGAPIPAEAARPAFPGVWSMDVLAWPTALTAADWKRLTL